MNKPLLFLKRNLYFKYMLSILWTIIVLYLSLGKMPDNQDVKINIPHLDKVVHFTMYFVYTFFLLLEIKNRSKIKTFSIVIYAISFGILMEIIQHLLFPYRSGDIYDGIFNSLGAIFSLIAFPRLKRLII